jgi:mono/diheme cytochrome c family protein
MKSRSSYSMVRTVLVGITGLVVTASSASGGRVASLRAQAPAPPGYTAAQADRGKVVYTESCNSCHGPSLRGGANEFAAPPLAGPFFLEKWSGRPIEDFFRYAADNMPPDKRIAAESYVDVMAYVLQVWRYPAGITELGASSPTMKGPIERQP